MADSTLGYRSHSRSGAVRRLTGVAAVGAVTAAAAACSLLAPSDRELLGGSVEPILPGAGGTGGASGSGGGGAAGSLGGSGNGGSVDAGGTEASPPISGVIPPPDAGSMPCTDCGAIRITGASELPLLLGSVGGAINMEMCPHDQAVVGFDYEYVFGTPADFGYFSSLAVVCGELVPDLEAGSVEAVAGELLPPRGAGGGRYGSGGRCAAGQVITSFEGSSNFDGMTSELRHIELDCAELTLATEQGHVTVGAPLPIAPISAEFAASTVLADVGLPRQSCPAGQVARGAVVYAGAWVDGFNLICGTPALARLDGQPCSSGAECRSGACEETCQPRPCPLEGECSCALFGERQFAFCREPAAHEAAIVACSEAGMHLSHAAEPFAHGWLRTTATTLGVPSAFWLGADDLAAEGTWSWIEGGGTLDPASPLWDDVANLGFEAENCLQMTRDGHWDDAPCEQELPFVCQTP